MSGVPTEFGPYLVYEQLGSGGMAQVHRAEVAGIEGFSRQVALKRMFEHVAANPDMVQAFVREARLASYMRHRNVAQTYELGKVGEIYFIAMELVSGPTLRDVLKHCGMTTGPMPVPVALNILNQICDALDYAHNLADDSGQQLGIIHRDVSPSNIIVSDGGVVKLIDFGIAKASAAGMQTMSGTIKGKFGYMAPEYIRGSIDARADLFAVGVIAHELLTNRPLFTGPEDMETLDRVTRMEVAPPSRFNPQVPVEIDDIVMTALARDPERRWQHASALRSALTTLTRRLGLAVHDSQVIEWITWAFDQTKPRGQNLRVQLSTPVRGHAAELADASFSTELATPPAGSSDSTTTMLDGTYEGPQASPHLEPDPYEVTVDHERHDALHPTGSRLSDDVIPTLIRPSGPRIEPPPRAPAARPPEPPLSLEGGSLSLARPPQGNPAPQARSSPVVAVVLVLLAAAIAATGVYFALPLLT